MTIQDTTRIEKKINWSKWHVIITIVGTCLTCMVIVYNWQKGIQDAISGLHEQQATMKVTQDYLKGEVDVGLPTSIKEVRAYTKEVEQKFDNYILTDK